jgi:hypothetical protein
MASGIYHSFFERLGRGAGDLQSVTVKCALVTAAYTPTADHDFFDDVTNEVAATGNYVAGGDTITVTVTDDDGNDRVDIVLGEAQWTTATITAAGAVYYVDTGGAASTDWLIAYIDFGTDQSSSSGTFTLSASTIRIPPTGPS